MVLVWPHDGFMAGSGTAPKKRRKKATERKDALVRVRVTEEQKALFIAAATKAGLDISSWLRSLGIREASGAGPLAPIARKQG